LKFIGHVAGKQIYEKSYDQVITSICHLFSDTRRGGAEIGFFAVGG
jgi:hypothetical protein